MKRNINHTTTARTGLIKRLTALISLVLAAVVTALCVAAAPASAAATISTNWAGAVMKGASGAFQGVAGEWRVPRLRATSGTRYASSWVGVDGWNKKQLIQTGPEETFSGGRAYYSAWIEILPEQKVSVPIRYTGTSTLARVQAGDRMFAYVMRTRPGVWTIHLQDKTQGWTYDKSFYYYGTGTSAEWIQEGPTVANRISVPSNFGSVTFTNLQVLEHGTWYYTAMNGNNRLNQRLNGRTYAVTGMPTHTKPQAITVRYTG